MNIKNLAILGALTSVMLTGCEMKEELFGTEGETSSKVGALQVDIKVKEPLSQTRADVSDINTSEYPVTVTGTSSEVQNIYKEYAAASEIPTTVTLPVGDYEVAAHTPGDLADVMGNAYYAGTKAMTITKGITTETTVTCKMQNNRITVVYGDSFLKGFESWTITINDGFERVLSYNQEDLNPADKFWYLAKNNVDKISVNIMGRTKEGNSINETRTFRKTDAAEQYDDVSEFFEGGDAIKLTMGAVASSNGNITNIVINAHITFENFSESIEIPVEDPITIKEPGNNMYVGNGVTITSDSYPTDVALDIVSIEGIQNVFVKASSSDATFTEMFAAMGMTSGDGLDLTSEAANNESVKAFFPTLPVAGEIGYQLVLNEALMQTLQAYAGMHKFTVKVVDALGNQLSETLNIKVEASNTGNTTSLVLPENMTLTMADMSDTSIKADAVITCPSGIKSMVVKIVSGCDGFTEALEMLLDAEADYGKSIDFLNGEELVGNTAVENLLGAVGQPTAMPNDKDTEYTFPIANFFLFIGITGPTDSGKAHEFHIELTDYDGNVSTGVYKLTLTN